eukprot:c5172_g1_i1.p1 GENE.c5172_g1_i1~~c5172_g1_i1.p1  ORF type:complete len:342 (+),score=46.84 c5172_g1_i1:116-1027(+)
MMEEYRQHSNSYDYLDPLLQPGVFGAVGATKLKGAWAEPCPVLKVDMPTQELVEPKEAFPAFVDTSSLFSYAPVDVDVSSRGSPCPFDDSEEATADSDENESALNNSENFDERLFLPSDFFGNSPQLGPTTPPSLGPMRARILPPAMPINEQFAIRRMNDRKLQPKPALGPPSAPSQMVKVSVGKQSTLTKKPQSPTSIQTTSNLNNPAAKQKRFQAPNPNFVPRPYKTVTTTRVLTNPSPSNGASGPFFNPAPYPQAQPNYYGGSEFGYVENYPSNHQPQQQHGYPYSMMQQSSAYPSFMPQ